MTQQKELENKYMQYQMLDQQIKQVQKQLQSIEQQLLEVTVAKQSLDELEKTKIGTEILVPISSGIFAKAELKNNSELILNVGARTAVTKNMDSAKKIVDTQLREIHKIQHQMVAEMQNMVAQAQMLEKDLSELTGQ